jgi:hypothetical protein
MSSKPHGCERKCYVEVTRREGTKAVGPLTRAVNQSNRLAHDIRSALPSSRLVNVLLLEHIDCSAVDGTEPNLKRSNANLLDVENHCI